MKITDETKEFISAHRFGVDRLVVSSNYPGEHTTPSLFFGVHEPFGGGYSTFGTKDIEQIKEIIEHMAKMAGLDVTFSKRFVPKYQPGDRVRPLTSDNDTKLGTVKSDTENMYNWNVAVVLDGDIDTGLYTYDELEPVTKSV